MDYTIVTLSLFEFFISFFVNMFRKSISANVDGPHDASSHKIDYIVLHVMCDHQPTSDHQY